MNQGPKRKHLSVISPYRRGREWATLALSDLSPEQIKLAQSVISVTEFRGVLVGAVLGSDEWDLRPMVLSDGAMFIIRRSRPGISIGTAHGAAIIDTQKAKELLPPFQLGEAEGRLWVARKFYNNLLTSTSTPEEKSAFERLHALEQCRKLLDLVQRLHEKQVVHGHIWNGNIAVDGAMPYLIDTALAPIFAGSDPETLAPELQRDPVPTAAADIFGLGLVIRGIFNDEEREQHRALLDRMLASDAAARPVLVEVMRSLGIASKPHTPVSPVSHSSPTGHGRVISRNLGSNPVQQGKLIKPGAPSAQSPSNPEPPEREPAFSKEISRDIVDALRTGVISAHAEAALSKPHVRERKQRVIEPISATPPSTPSSSVASDRRTRSSSNEKLAQARAARPGMLSLLIFIFTCVATIGLFRHGYLDRFLFGGDLSSEDTEQFKAYWSSRQPSLMREVARAASISPGSKLAQAIIVKDVMGSDKIEGVKTKLIRVAFNPRWEAELTERDRLVILRLGLRELVPEMQVSLSDIGTFHPGVMLAVLAELPVEFESESWAMIPTKRLAKLASPYGDSFKILVESGVDSAQHMSVRALAHLLSGDFSVQTIERYFAGQDAPEKLLAAIAPILDQLGDAQAVNYLFNVLSNDKSKVGERLTWFQDDKNVGWEGVTPRVKIALAGESLPADPLTLEQYADLLSFPSLEVRKQSLVYLQQKLSPEYTQLLQILAASDHKLPRFETVFLISALSLPGEQGAAATTGWFSFEPEPSTVAALILTLKEAEQPNTFNIEGARYLLNRRWNAPLEVYAELASHKEPLVRAFVYAGIDAGTMEGFRMLKDYSRVEKDERLAKQIVEKLEIAVRAAGR